VSLGAGVQGFPWAGAVQAGDPVAVAALDDLPVWSAPFGQALLESVRLRHGLRVLDVGCGLGYPLLELAACLGPTGCCTGLDPWEAALVRAREKAWARGQAVTFVQGEAEAMPFPEGAFDLVISNNGLNNVAAVDTTLSECFRVAAPGAQLVMTANLPGTFEGFYQAFSLVLGELGLEDRVSALQAHREAKRRPAEAWTHLVGAAGFAVESVRQETFTWSLLDGTALFRHAALRLSFLPAWEAAAGKEAPRVLAALESRLNAMAARSGGLRLEVPFLCLSAVRP